MSDTEVLLCEIERFLAGRDMKETTFGYKAVNDGKFVRRLRRGRRCWPETSAKVRGFIRAAQVASQAGEHA